MVSAVTADQRRVAAAVSARAAHRGFRAGAGTVPRLGCRPVIGVDHPAHHQWQDEARAFAQRDLSGVDYAYLWADGIHVNVRPDEARLCLLVLIGVRTDGRKELAALDPPLRRAQPE